MKPVTHWLLAIRPKTLTISITPVLVGSALAWSRQQQLDAAIFVVTLLAALLIQIGTNLHNDVADFERGTDQQGRDGPPRATAEGWLSSSQVRTGALLSFIGAFLLGGFLAAVGGWPIILLGLVSIAAGYGYTGGPKPIAYSASGELFVFLFFGLAAVIGTYYLQTLTYSNNVLIAATGIGLLAAAVLLVNNYRDLDSDRAAGKHTVCYYLTASGCHWAYAGLLLLPFLLPLSKPLFPPGSHLWFVLAALPLAGLLITRFTRSPSAAELNGLLAITARLQLVYGLLLIAGLLW